MDLILQHKGSRIINRKKECLKSSVTILFRLYGAIRSEESSTLKKSTWIFYKVWIGKTTIYLFNKSDVTDLISWDNMLTVINGSKVKRHNIRYILLITDPEAYYSYEYASRSLTLAQDTQIHADGDLEQPQQPIIDLSLLAMGCGWGSDF